LYWALLFESKGIALLGLIMVVQNCLEDIGCRFGGVLMNEVDCRCWIECHDGDLSWVMGVEPASCILKSWGLMKQSSWEVPLAWRNATTMQHRLSKHNVWQWGLS